MAIEEENRSALFGKISDSEIFKRYEQAFVETTRLPLVFRPVKTKPFALQGRRYENPFCALMAEAGCAKCVEAQERLGRQAARGSRTLRCFAGLCDSAFPVSAGSKLVGFLQTGQVMLEKPTKDKFGAIAKQLGALGLGSELGHAEDAYFSSQVLSPKTYRAMLRLLGVFSEHLSLVSEEVAVGMDNAEPPVVRRAKEFIEEHAAESITLGDLANAVNVSTFYLCKVFKKHTGLTYTQYVALVRINKAKALLQNRNLRISEIAYGVGYQTFSHFNRVFNSLVGESPSRYRRRTLG